MRVICLAPDCISPLNPQGYFHIYCGVNACGIATIPSTATMKYGKAAEAWGPAHSDGWMEWASAVKQHGQLAVRAMGQWSRGGPRAGCRSQ